MRAEPFSREERVLNELDEGNIPDPGNLRAAIDDYDAARGES